MKQGPEMRILKRVNIQRFGFFQRVIGKRSAVVVLSQHYKGNHTGKHLMFDSPFEFVFMYQG